MMTHIINTLCQIVYCFLECRILAQHRIIHYEGEKSLATVKFMQQIIIIVWSWKFYALIAGPFAYLVSNFLATKFQNIYRRQGICSRDCMGRIYYDCLCLDDAFLHSDSNGLANQHIQKVHIIKSLTSKFCKKTWINDIILWNKAKEALI